MLWRLLAARVSRWRHGEDMDRRESMLAMEIKLKEKEIALVEAQARLQSQSNQQDFQTKMMEMLQSVIANKK